MLDPVSSHIHVLHGMTASYFIKSWIPAQKYVLVRPG